MATIDGIPAAELSVDERHKMYRRHRKSARRWRQVSGLLLIIVVGWPLVPITLLKWNRARKRRNEWKASIPEGVPDDLYEDDGEVGV